MKKLPSASSGISFLSSAQLKSHKEGEKRRRRRRREEVEVEEETRKEACSCRDSHNVT